MTLRRVAAFAQALAIASFALLPGLGPGGPALALAAVAPPEPTSSAVFDATGNGIGCRSGSRKFKGPRILKDPPWPPGAKPTPSPAPSPSPTPSASPETSTEPTAQGTGIVQAATGAAIAQAAAADPTPANDGGDADIAPDVTTAPGAADENNGSRFLAGIDVSHHNDNIDYNKVRKAGNRFVFIKATQDVDFIDPMFPANMAKARAAGLAAGGYHFFDYTLDGKAQADHFVDRLEAADAIDGALPPVVDVECWRPLGPSTHVLSEARLRDFVARVYARTGRLPIIYTSAFMWKQVVGNAAGFEALPLWAACWGCDAPPSLAAGWNEWAFWQTGVSKVPGVGRLDGNFFSGSGTDLNALKLRPVSIDGGAAVTGQRRVEIDLGGRDATQYRTSPDGKDWSRWRSVGAAPHVDLGAQEGLQTIYVQLRAGKGLRSPAFSDTITLDLSGPEVSAPAVRLREGVIGNGASTIPVGVSWTASDAVAGLSDATVSVACGDARIQRFDAPGTGAPEQLVEWQGDAALTPGVDCQVTAIARDGVGNATRRSVDGVVAERIPADGASSVTVTGGDEVGIVARRGPDGGRAAIMVDGEPVGLFDLYAEVLGEPEIVFVAPLNGPRHEVSIEATGTSDPASSGGRVAIEGVVTLGSTAASGG